MKDRIRKSFPDLLAVAGAGSVVTGAGIVSTPLAFVVAGAFLLAGSVLLARTEDKG